MDITPIYDLRTRLKAGAIAGTGLAAEDFRLKRAVEAMGPLAAASPVFARLAKLAEAVLEPDCPDREGALLDALTLADAVLCTQARVAAEGPFEMLKTTGCGSLAADVPYSTLSALLDALSNSGNGRFSLVLEMHEEHPELFEDYRVKAALVNALGAAYAELADMAVEWLKASGEAILPLLYNGFDPRGKKEMVRRVQIVEAVAARNANRFYRENLPQAEKEVRAALIYALRHDPDNEELLLELARSEKGNCKKMACWALADMEGEEAEAFWLDYRKRKPEEAMSYLQQSRAGWAAEIVADGFLETFRPWAAGQGTETDRSCKAEAGMEAVMGKGDHKPALTRGTASIMENYLCALPGKKGTKICEAFRLAASLGRGLDRPVEGEKGKWCPGTPAAIPGCRSIPFSGTVPVLLNDSLIISPDEELEKTAVELEESCGEAYFAPALTARLLSFPEQECIQWVEERIWKKSLLGRKIRRELFPHLKGALSGVCWEEKEKRYVLQAFQISPADGRMNRYSRPLGQSDDISLAQYFVDLLMSCGDSGLDEVLTHFVRQDCADQRGRLAEYFYKRALVSSDNRKYLEPLKYCGWTQCAGLGIRYCKGKGRVAFWELYGFLQQMPGDGPARAEEARQIFELVKKGEIKIPNVNMEYFETLIQEIQNS